MEYEAPARLLNEENVVDLAWQRLQSDYTLLAVPSLDAMRLSRSCSCAYAKVVAPNAVEDSMLIGEAGWVASLFASGAPWWPDPKAFRQRIAKSATTALADQPPLRVYSLPLNVGALFALRKCSPNARMSTNYSTPTYLLEPNFHEECDLFITEVGVPSRLATDQSKVRYLFTLHEVPSFVHSFRDFQDRSGVAFPVANTSGVSHVLLNQDSDRKPMRLGTLLNSIDEIPQIIATPPEGMRTLIPSWAPYTDAIDMIYPFRFRRWASDHFPMALFATTRALSDSIRRARIGRFIQYYVRALHTLAADMRRSPDSVRLDVRPILGEDWFRHFWNAVAKLARNPESVDSEKRALRENVDRSLAELVVPGSGPVHDECVRHMNSISEAARNMATETLRIMVHKIRAVANGDVGLVADGLAHVVEWTSRLDNHA